MGDTRARLWLRAAVPILMTFGLATAGLMTYVGDAGTSTLQLERYATPAEGIGGKTFHLGALCLPKSLDRSEGASDFCLSGVTPVVGTNPAFLVTVLDTSNSKLYDSWDVRFVFFGEVVYNPHGAGWPFRDVNWDKHFQGWFVVNVQWAPDGNRGTHCLNDIPFGNEQQATVGPCSDPVKAADTHFSHMVWNRGEEIVGVNLTNRSRDHKIPYCLSATKREDQESVAWIPCRLTGGAGLLVQSWWPKPEHALH